MQSPVFVSSIAPPSVESRQPCVNKVTVVGAAGQVGIACVLALIQAAAASEVVMVDMIEDRLKGEALDIQQSLTFLINPPRVKWSTDYSHTEGSAVVVITAGVRQKTGENRLSLLSRNVAVMQSIIPEVVKRSPDAVLLLATNPCDIMAFIAWKLSGLPAHRVISTGCNLDTGRFRYLLSREMEVDSRSIHGWIIGEHGDSSVPVWSGVTVSSRPIDVTESEQFPGLHRKVVSAAYDIIKLKGYTNWAIGASVSQICTIVLRDMRRALSVGTMVKDIHGVPFEVFQAVPCVLGRTGVQKVVNLHLRADEESMFQASAATLNEAQKEILHLLESPKA